LYNFCGMKMGGRVLYGRATFVTKTNLGHSDRPCCFAFLSTILHEISN
jgi:hypothetical protein